MLTFYDYKFSGWTISRECLSVLLPMLQPGMVTLECGSGLSTYMFDLAGCEHTALENDPEYACDSKSVVLCKLVGDPPFYDWKPPHPYDLILIDGPLGIVGRNGILRVLGDCLHKDTIIVIDDTNRTAEAALMMQIQYKYQYDFTMYSCQPPKGQTRFSVGTRR